MGTARGGYGAGGANTGNMGGMAGLSVPMVRFPLSSHPSLHLGLLHVCQQMFHGHRCLSSALGQLHCKESFTTAADMYAITHFSSLSKRASAK